MSNQRMNPWLVMAANQARITMNRLDGGPFGAVIVDEHGQLVAVASNSVLKDHDPTAHAEINAIRLASSKLQTHDLQGCTLYTTAYPCPMCLSAIMWANIKTIVFGATAQEAASIGFRDDFMYAYIQQGMKDVTTLNIIHHDCPSCQQLFIEYQDQKRTLY